MESLRIFETHNNYITSNFYKEVSYCQLENHLHYKDKSYDYKIKYLQSNNTQYIDTGIKPNNNSTIRFVTSVECTNANRRIIIGNYYASATGEKTINIEIYKSSSNNKLRLYTAQDSSSVDIIDSNTLVFNKPIDIDVTLNCDTNTWTGTISNNGNTYIISKSAKPNMGTQLRNFRLFLDYRTNPSSVAYPLIMYYCKIYLDDKLVRDFIPVRKDNIGYMYDKVSKQIFENKGTGSFTLGPDIVPIQYLESNKAQYINTDIKPCMNKIRCICDMMPLDTADTAFFGTRGTYYLFYNVGGNYFWPTSKCETINGTLQINNIYHVDWNKGILEITGNNGVYQKGIRSNSTQDNTPMYIFDFNPNDSSNRKTKARLYFFKIYIDDILLRDLIPIRIGTIGYLYDKISNKIFGNLGTGNFVLGPDK